MQAPQPTVTTEDAFKKIDELRRILAACDRNLGANPRPLDATEQYYLGISKAALENLASRFATTSK